jgi:hypothetical protein
MQPYLEGRLAVLERNEFVYHVTECATCEAEVIAYREVFLALRKLDRVEDVPERISVGVMAHLHAEGLVHEPMFPLLHRVLDRFLDLPARVRYPAAAIAAVTVLYAPLALVLGGARGSLAGATEALARAIVWVRTALGARPELAEVEGYTRTARTLARAVSELVTPETFVLAAVVVAVVVFSMSLILRRKRHSGHALFI